MLSCLNSCLNSRFESSWLRGVLGLAIAVWSSLLTMPAFADGSVIDKLYHPYVDALESEIEYRGLRQNLPAGNLLPDEVHQLSYGAALNHSFFGEVKVVGFRPQSTGFELNAFASALQWQLTEQGEYSADWGLVFEFEHGVNQDLEEVAVGLLAEKEFGRWSATANLFAIQEWGDDIQDEFETTFAVQARYRYSRLFEPAMEFYLGQDTVGIGPVIIGQSKLGARKSLSWEFGVIAGLTAKSPNSTLRLLFEYEF